MAAVDPMAQTSWSSCSLMRRSAEVPPLTLGSSKLGINCPFCLIDMLQSFSSLACVSIPFTFHIKTQSSMFGGSPSMTTFTGLSRMKKSGRSPSLWYVVVHVPKTVTDCKILFCSRPRFISFSYWLATLGSTQLNTPQRLAQTLLCRGMELISLSRCRLPLRCPRSFLQEQQTHPTSSGSRKQVDLLNSANGITLLYILYCCLALFNGKEGKLPSADEASRRVIAPYVKTFRRSELVTSTDKTEFSYYLQKKPISLLQNVSGFISDMDDLISVLHETADVLKVVTDSSGATLYMVDSLSEEITLHSRYANISRYDAKWKIETGRTLAAHVAFKKENVMVDDIIGDQRFPEGIGWRGTTVKAIMCVPVVTPEEDCIAVIELFKEVDEGPYKKTDLQIVVATTGWMGAAINQHQQKIALQKQQELNDYLLGLCKHYFADHLVVDKIISEIMMFAKETIGAERGSFFIIDQESDELVADLFDDGDEKMNELQHHKKTIKIRFSKERGIAGLVARTGQTILDGKEFNYTNATHRRLMKNIMMTTSDLSGQAKSFFVAKKICDGMFNEYYQQGDIEKKMGLCPLDMLDRDKQENISDDQRPRITRHSVKLGQITTHSGASFLFNLSGGQSRLLMGPILKVSAQDHYCLVTSLFPSTETILPVRAEHVSQFPQH
uniref:3',5'-cyclic-GMP phosphodiesterase n=1 Tax=Timema cristinae TaxID=61476 RepID=A0A7R9CSD4_TIMCR|nr:unnamed protein product [Timema cristinae]